MAARLCHTTWHASSVTVRTTQHAWAEALLRVPVTLSTCHGVDCMPYIACGTRRGMMGPVRVTWPNHSLQTTRAHDHILPGFRIRASCHRVTASNEPMRVLAGHHTAGRSSVTHTCHRPSKTPPQLQHFAVNRRPTYVVTAVQNVTLADLVRPGPDCLHRIRVHTHIECCRRSDRSPSGLAKSSVARDP